MSTPRFVVHAAAIALAVFKGLPFAAPPLGDLRH
jgi:hypothetical protein